MKAANDIQQRHPVPSILIYVTIFLLAFGAAYFYVEKGHKTAQDFSNAVYFAMVASTTIG